MLRSCFASIHPACWCEWRYWKPSFPLMVETVSPIRNKILFLIVMTQPEKPALAMRVAIARAVRAKIGDRRVRINTRKSLWTIVQRLMPRRYPLRGGLPPSLSHLVSGQLVPKLYLQRSYLPSVLSTRQYVLILTPGPSRNSIPARSRQPIIFSAVSDLPPRRPSPASSLLIVGFDTPEFFVSSSCVQFKRARAALI